MSNLIHSVSQKDPVHDFILTNCDTDSISFCRKDMTPFTKEELKFLKDELNSLFPDTIVFEDDGYFDTFIVLRAKNYIMKSGDKIKYKGSGLKNQNKEPALKEFMFEIVDAMLEGRVNYSEIYHKYVNEAINVQDITRWANKKTITDKILKPQRTNESKVLDAIQGLEYSEGDKMYFFFLDDDSLCAAQNFKGNYNKKKLLEKLFKTTKLFENVIDVKLNFINYSLKRNQKLLEELCLTNKLG